MRTKCARVLCAAVAIVAIGTRTAEAKSARAANDAAAALTSAMDRLYNAPQPDAASLRTLADWRGWYNDNASNTRAVVRAFTTWEGTLRGSGAPKALLRYRDALRVWVADQAEQTAITGSCIREAATPSSIPYCVVVKAGPRLSVWQRHTNEVARRRPS